ncbi:MAG: hypothetical protein Q8J74_02765 [Candidatus Didemnitutus sp.]|nr:hypothetical protein [Candidatus Didemnitutus sp.]
MKLLTVLYFLSCSQLAQAEFTNYADVLRATYGEGYEALVAHRIEYARQNGIRTHADYSTIGTVPTIVHLKAPKLARRAGTYDARTHTIEIFDPSPRVLRHELGHSLQRNSVLAAAELSLAFELGLEGTLDHRVAYLLRLYELEVMWPEFAGHGRLLI